jgi:hypothetical protein
MQLFRRRADQDLLIRPTLRATGLLHRQGPILIPMEDSPGDGIVGGKGRQDGRENVVRIDATVGFAGFAPAELVAAFAEGEGFAGEEALGIGVPEAHASWEPRDGGHSPPIDGIGNYRKTMIGELGTNVHDSVANKG